MSTARVLYLAGSGRSGSTLVTTVLGQLPGFLAAGELRYLWRRGIVENRPCGCGAPIVDCPLWSRVLADLPEAEPAAIAGRLATRLRLRGLPALLRRHRRGRPPVPGHPDDTHLARLYASIAEHAFAQDGRPGVIVDSSKLPPYGALIGSLPGVDLYVLHVVRDPRATAFSWRRRRALDGGADDRLMSRPPVWKAALLWLVWNTATVRLWGAGNRPGGAPDRYLRVRYEDFVADPAAITARIVRFVGATPGELPFPSPDTVRLAPTHSVAGNPSRHRTGLVGVVADTEWVTGLPARGYAVVTALTGPVLRRFGYPLRRPATVAADSVSTGDPGSTVVPSSPVAGQEG
ncbi:sulfotransferase family protein [Micromonospora pisi]|uniref:Sulfotransferase family protein n=1 Tax=Micromonospora pisi TaxID=589240 RepID=A0A495JRG8_9ACTN|nr:sulfotransferase [Micromonospora pisi]RKR91235.1 sulfotransferase family protein [Micromonospora pisi]